jgi:hypothetical protein
MLTRCEGIQATLNMNIEMGHGKQKGLMKDEIAIDLI